MERLTRLRAQLSFVVRAPRMKTLTVEIPTADVWPTADEMDSRGKIIAALQSAGIGQFVGCGGGAGAVDFSFKAEDFSGSDDLIRRTVRQHVDAEPRIRITG